MGKRTIGDEINTQISDSQKVLMAKLKKKPWLALKFQKNMLGLWNKLCEECKARAADNPTNMDYCADCNEAVKPNLRKIKDIQNKLDGVKL